ncbi:hypothetical protein [Bacillus cereus]|uniref:Uncharacterized protein n=1 Tax=Bacillus cereus TaxID=1396 RepID=A0A2B9E2V4_BACCE|nr:hypothetical protein [Bacillus cereus]PGM93661.1 hypothetical protein CN958_12440 [Bacillus cereus]
MKQEEDGRGHPMIHTPYSYSPQFEGVSQSAATLEDTEKINKDVSFCCIVHIPDGFVYVPNGTLKISYNVSQLSVVKETCQKTIVVDHCGPVDVTLNLLKVVGSIPYMVSAKVQGECGQQYGNTTKSDNRIDLSYMSHISVNCVLKLSVESLPEYHIEEQNVAISNFQVTHVQEQGSNFLRFTGTVGFQNVPHS